MLFELQVINSLVTLDLLASLLKDLRKEEDFGQEPWNPTRRSVMHCVCEEDMEDWLGDLYPITGLVKFEAPTLSRLPFSLIFWGLRCA